MKLYSKEEIKLLRIQIGCVIRKSRLEKKLSQEDVGHLVDTNSTGIGRIERGENVRGWENLILICQHLEVDLSTLFYLKSKTEILKIIEDTFKMEVKLNQGKRDYYHFLIKQVNQYS